MDAYTGFAEVYDRCMDNIPYDEWAQNIRNLLHKHGIKDGIVCELGCGTGEMTERLSEMGYDMIGIDSSEDMLMEAREKLYERSETDEPGILYLQQDMRELELYGTVAACVSVCDSMNYLLTKDDLLTVFRLVNNYLDKDGLFLFDMKTEACFAALGDETRVEQFRDATVIWENSYRKRKKQNCYRITMFLKDRGSMYEKLQEVHVQQAYSAETVKQLLTEAGMVFLGALDAETLEPADETSERILFLAKEGYQEGKCYDAPAEADA
ncbi:MAG: class I SAM-dependent methyltransferase [Lachnospiraceae bacterium]|nr:class I SAM-dependent methyltransferase [Lachnospiraceae bacterium]